MKRISIIMALMVLSLVSIASAETTVLDDFSESDGAFGASPNDVGVYYYSWDGMDVGTDFTNYAYLNEALYVTGSLNTGVYSNSTGGFSVGDTFEFDLNIASGAFWASLSASPTQVGILIYGVEIGEGDINVMGSLVATNAGQTYHYKIEWVGDTTVDIFRDDVLIINDGTPYASASELTQYSFGYPFYEGTWTIDNITKNSPTTPTPPSIITRSPLTDPTIKIGESQLFSIGVLEEGNDTLSYVWTVDSVDQNNNASSFTFDTTGLSEGTPTLTVTVSDVDGNDTSTWNPTLLATLPYEANYVNEDLDEIAIDGLGTLGVTFVRLISLIAILIIMIWIGKRLGEKKQ